MSKLTEAKMVNIEISVRVTDNSGLTLGESSWEAKGFTRKYLPYLNPVTFAGHLGDIMKAAAAQAEAHADREERVAYEQAKARTTAKKIWKYHPETDGGRLAGDEVKLQVGAPGIGTVTYKITCIDAEWVYGYVVENNSRIMEPWEAI
jgi:hypothetical protein